MKYGRKYIILFMAFLLTLTFGTSIAIAKDEGIAKDEIIAKYEVITKEMVEEYHKFEEENKEDIIVYGYDCPMCGSNTRTTKVATTERYVDTVTNPPGYSPGVYKRYEVTAYYQLTCSCGYKADFSVSEGYKYVKV